MTAAEKILQKALVGSNLDSQGWSRIQAGLRDRAFFSSQVESARFLHEARRMIAERAAGGLSESEIRRDLREVLRGEGYAPKEGEAGTMKDLFSKQRLDVLIRTNVDQAKGYVSHLRATTPGAILAFPAYELVRVRQRRQPRDWTARWNAAAAKVGFEGVARQGGMIALKTSPVWAALSRFGTPYPPFDFNSGMGVRDVAKSRCREIGLLGEDEQPKIPPRPDFNGSLAASIPMADDSPEARKLKEVFGDQVDFRGNVAHWRGELIGDVLDGKVKKISLGVGALGEKTSFSHALFANHASKHFEGNEKDKRNIPMERGDYELLPTLWRTPDRTSYDEKRKAYRLELDTLDGGVLTMFWEKIHGPLTVYKTIMSQGAW